MPVLIKVTRRSKDQEEQHKVVARAKINKTKYEWQCKEQGVTIQETPIFEKDEIYLKNMTEVKIPSYELKEDVRKLKPDQIKHQAKKQEEYMKINEQRHSEPDAEVPLADTKDDFMKGKSSNEESHKTPSKTIKIISKIPSAEKEHEKVVLKPVVRPDKSKGVPMKEKEIAPKTKKTEEGVAAKPVLLAAKSEQKEPEVFTKAKRVPTENDEVEKRSYRSSKDLEQSEKDEKPNKEDKVKIQVKKTDKILKEEAKPLINKNGRHILKECEEKDISLKPVEHMKTCAELEKISPKVEKPKEEKPSLTTVTKAKESPKEECEISVPKKSGSLPGISMEEEEISLKPVELVKRAEEVKMTLSPRAEPIPLLKKSNATASEQKKASQEHSEKEKLPLIKELSPGAVQLQKIPTQEEEEVLKEFEDEKEEEEETWGWEVVSSEVYEAGKFDTTMENGAIETPGGTGDKIGERESETSPLVVHACPGPQK